MTLEDFQEEVKRTDFTKDQELDFIKRMNEIHKLIYGVIGIQSEAGEVAGVIKDYIRGSIDSNLMKNRLILELGDVLWYIVYCADEIGTDLETIMFMNKKKLRKRYPNGFEVKDA